MDIIKLQGKKMIINIWGSRGSLPAPGRETVKYGGESTCLEVISDTGDRIIIDAGSGIRKLGNSIIKNGTENDIIMLFTHAHWDHLAGFPFFKPAYKPGFTITLCGGPVPQESILKYLTHQMEAPYFPVNMTEMKAGFVTGCRCGEGICDKSPGGRVKSVKCESIPLNHPNGGYGFKFRSGDKSFVFFPDNELRYHHNCGVLLKDHVEFCSGADLLIHDAQYTEDEYQKTRSWGHSTFTDAVELALSANVKRLGLFHHDPDRTDDDLSANLELCRKLISEKKSNLECFACMDGMSITL